MLSERISPHLYQKLTLEPCIAIASVIHQLFYYYFNRIIHAPAFRRQKTLRFITHVKRHKAPKQVPLHRDQFSILDTRFMEHSLRLEHIQLYPLQTLIQLPHLNDEPLNLLEGKRGLSHFHWCIYSYPLLSEGISGQI